MQRFLAILFVVALPSITLAVDQEEIPLKNTEESIEIGDALPLPPQYYSVKLQGLNKVTGRASTLEGSVGTTLRFGNLEIVPRKCWKSPPEDQPENTALLEILELKSGEPPQTIFTGWMFSSSPGLSGLEHPVYDITVVACEAAEEPEKEDAPKKDEAPKKEEPTKKGKIPEPKKGNN